ncbi:hypothetical protein LDENG_00153640, partial [Lucifuga dentata]
HIISREAAREERRLTLREADAKLNSPGPRLSGKPLSNHNIAPFESIHCTPLLSMHVCVCVSVCVCVCVCVHILKDHTTHFACLSLIYSLFIHVRLLTIISQRTKLYFSFPDILQNLLIFQNQIFKRYTHLTNPCFSC